MCNIKRLFLDSQLSVLYSPISNFLFSIYQVFKEAISRYLREHGYDNIRLKAVFFDMDGVLFNSMPYHADAWHTVMERHGLHLSREEAYMHEGRTGAATINIVYQRQYGKDATPEMIESIYAEKSEEFNRHPEPERMSGAWEVLQKIKAEGLTPVLVTGSGQHSLLDRLAHNFPGMFQRERMVTAFVTKDTRQQIERIEAYIPLIATATDIPMLMGIEGNIRQTYYEPFDTIIDGFSMGNRTKMPPSNEVNAMISFANSMCYSLCLDAIYHTQLNPTISFLHEPGVRRYSLALDMAEIFKPILADRLIFSMFNRKQLRESDFDQHLNRCLLKQSSMKKVAQEWEERTKETIKHRKLGRSVSYRHLIKLECYKLTKHLLGMEEYKPLKMWW